tara:strand:+ start:1791 stop:2324 length:534 start_codon:yes stop_codon:yes gene_type:complete
MIKKQQNNLPRYCVKNKNRQFPLKYYLLETQAWNELTKSSQKVLFDLYSRLQWINMGRKSRPDWEIKNNGQIEVASITLMKYTGINSKQTITSAIHQLIEVGFIRLTRQGSNRITHMYKILLPDCVPTVQQRWRKYPEKNWKGELPKCPNSLVGVKTRFKSKSHPKKVDLDKSKKVD